MTASEIPPAVRLRATRRSLDSRRRRRGRIVSKARNSRKARVVAPAAVQSTARRFPFIARSCRVYGFPRENGAANWLVSCLLNEARRVMANAIAVKKPEPLRLTIADLHARRGCGLHRAGPPSRIERGGASRQRRNRLRPERAVRGVHAVDRGPARSDAPDPDD